MILEVQNGCFGYPKQPVILENINLRLEEGHILAILGPNGIGKTTLLKCMIGLLPWHSGKTLLYDKDIHTLKPKEVWSTISYIPQSHGFAFSYTGLEMVLLGRSAHLGMFQQPGKEELEMAEAMMERVGISHLANKDCNRMSGGELQMVLIARALINEPKLIILDEPTVGLDPAQVIEIRRLIRELGKSHTVILSSHILSEVQAVCSQVLILSKGHLVAVGAPEQLAEKLNPGSRLRATALGGGQTVLKAVGSIPGIRKVEIESEADGQVTFTAESADASDRRAEVSRALSQAGCTVLALAAENRTLEEVFLALTENESETPSDEGEEKTE